MHLRRPLRLAATVAVAALLATGLTGCDQIFGTCVPKAASGEASDSVTASGRFGTQPTVHFPTPLHASTTQVSTLIAGKDPRIAPNQQIVVDITILDGTTGKEISKTDYSGRIDPTGASGPASFVVDKVPVKGLQKALVCAQPGERMAVVLPPKEGFAPGSLGQGVGKDDSVVVVADIRRTYLARANGTNQVMGDGLPAVVLGPDGRPGITVPSEPAPKKLVVADLKKGSGPVLKRGDTAMVHFTDVLWSDGTVLDSTWQNGAPVPLPLKTGEGGLQTKGLVSAMAGQRVGSQVLAILPPSEAYGKKGGGSVPGNATLVFVVDILGKV